MKKTVLGSLVVVLVSLSLGFSSDPVYLHTSGRKMVSADGLSCYEATWEEVRSLKYHHALEYVGSEENYHLIRWVTKIIPASDAVDCFAVPKAQFTPRYTYPFSAQHSWGQGSFYLFDEDLRNDAKWIAIGRITAVKEDRRQGSSIIAYELTFVPERWEKRHSNRKEIQLITYMAMRVPSNTGGLFRVYGDELKFSEPTGLIEIEKL
jgi:hypothetical protein